MFWLTCRRIAPLRLCITSGTFDPDVGGPPTYLLALSEALVRRGHAVRVVTHGSRGGSYPYRVARISRDLPAPLRLAAFTAATLCDARLADLIFMNDYGLPPAVANLFLRKPSVLKIVGDFAWEYATRHHLLPGPVDIDEFQQRRFGATVERLRRMQCWYARSADLVITPSRYLAGIVEGWGVPTQRIRVIYNAPTPLGTLPDRRSVRQRFGVTDDQYLVVCAARLAPWKGLPVLIRALATARQSAPHLRLLIVGDGTERDALAAQAAPVGEAVQFTGELMPRDARATIAASDAVVLVSGYEGLSHVLLEAMHAGRPIIASAVGGNLELIGDGDNGLLVPYLDERALSAKLALLAADSGIGERLGGQARIDSARRAWPQLVDRTVAVFAEAIAARPSGRAAL